jgi:hypothetical protein
VSCLLIGARRPIRQDIRATNHAEETDYSDDSDEVAVFRINVNTMTTDQSKHPLFDVTIHGTPLTIMADSGSSINILDERDYDTLFPRPTLERTRTKVRRIIAYGSRSQTTTEQHYSQTEREALALVWACEHFHLYIYGKPVNIYTDHKPLAAIYGNATSKPPARIELWALRLQPYQTTVHYRKGEENPADYMSSVFTLKRMILSCS